MPLDFIFLILWIIGSWLGTSKYFNKLNLSVVFTKHLNKALITVYTFYLNKKSNTRQI